jgi:hypothetical protein
MRQRSLGDITFAEFDHNPNFVHDDILPDIIVRLRNQENCSLCRMYFIRDEILDSLMEQ